MKIGKCHFVFSWVILGIKSFCHVIPALDGLWSQDLMNSHNHGSLFLAWGPMVCKELADMLYYTPFSSIIKNELRGFIIIGVRFDEEFNKEKGFPRKLLGNLWVPLPFLLKKSIHIC